MDLFAYSRPEGFVDVDATQSHRLRWAEETLLGVFARSGYQEVRVPSLEYRDLYHPERIGDALHHQLLSTRLSVPADFPADVHAETTENADAAKENEPAEPVHELVLRPDLTAPLARMFVEQVLRHGPPKTLPYRVCYAAQTFRDLKSDGLLLREHRQVGIECIGEPSLRADLEVILAAIDAVELLQVRNWYLRLGHAGITAAMVEELGLRGDDALAVERHLERAAKLRWMTGLEDEPYLRYVEGFAALLLRARSDLEPELTDIRTKSADHWRVRLPQLHEAYLQRLLAQRFRLTPAAIERSLFLSRLDPDPESFFPKLRELCADGPGQKAADELAELWRRLRPLTDAQVVFTAAAGRGIAYYTGMTFQLHSPDTESAYTELGGGGRYDQLHRWIHERAVRTARLRGAEINEQTEAAPSMFNGVGMAFGLERLVAALPNDSGPQGLIVDVQVVISCSEREDEALLFARDLRRGGRIVTVDMPATDNRSAAGFFVVFDAVDPLTVAFVARNQTKAERLTVGMAQAHIQGDLNRA